MNTLDVDPKAEAQELHSILEDFRNLLLIRMKRKDTTPVRVVVIGKLLNHFDELGAVHCPDQHLEETEAAAAPVGA